MTSSSAVQSHSSVPAGHAWRRAFTDLPREHGFEPMRVEGTLPAELQGTLYRNGPSNFSAQGRPYGHWFDGDGAVSAVRLLGGRAEGAVKLVQSTALLAERAAGRALSVGYGTVAPGGLLQRLRAPVKNSANTSVIVWQDRLFALMEAGLPTELDPRDLSTKGETNLEGAVIQSFSAHPHRIAERKTSYNFGVRLNGPPKLDIYALPDDGKARRMVTIPLSGTTMIHDFAVTNRHLVFFAPPLRMNIPKVLLGLSSVGDSYTFKADEGTDIIVVPIDAPKDFIRFKAESFFQWHFANAFERGDEIVVDAVTSPDFASNTFLKQLPSRVPDQGYAGTLTRNVVNMKTRKLTRSVLLDAPAEFPRVSGAVTAQPYRYTYVAALSGGDAARGMFDRVGKVDVERGTVERVALGEDQYPSEPIFVRKQTGQQEDDGYLLTLVYDGRTHQSHVAVLDAARVGEGPVARAYFGHHIPFTFHGNFVRASHV